MRLGRVHKKKTEETPEAPVAEVKVEPVVEVKEPAPAPETETKPVKKPAAKKAVSEEKAEEKKTAKKTDSLSKCAEASLGAQNREQSGEKIWAPDRTCHRWAQGFHCWFICLFIQHTIKSCPEQGRGIALGWRALPIPRTHSLFLGCQEMLPRPGPASGSLSGVSTGTQDLRPRRALG